MQHNSKSMKKMTALILIPIITIMTASCSSLERAKKDMESDFGGGLNRIVTVYTADGEVLKTYKGKIDIAATEGGYVKFDFDGKRIMYYNCYVEVIEIDEEEIKP